jgi:hypothetical protein
MLTGKISRKVVRFGHSWRSTVPYGMSDRNLRMPKVNPFFNKTKQLWCIDFPRQRAKGEKKRERETFSTKTQAMDRRREGAAPG